jgi:F-type H+-transporting ATPase subunit alpha
MALRPEEITSVLLNELKGFEDELTMVNVGTVLEVGDGIARVYGLQGCKSGELLEFPSAPRPTCRRWASRSTLKKTTLVS